LLESPNPVFLSLRPLGLVSVPRLPKIWP